MSGHSKWSKIKHQKGANDAKRGQLFTKLARNITVAAQEGGGNPEMNVSLRMAIDRAKTENMPADNIERAISRGTGELTDSNKLVTVIYEAYSPNQIPLLIQCQTDNTNRAYTEVKNVVENSFGGKMSSEGSISWQFKQKGYFLLNAQRKYQITKGNREVEYTEQLDPEELLLEIAEIDGVEDANADGSTIEVFTNKENYRNVYSDIRKGGIDVRMSELGWYSEHSIKINGDIQGQLKELVEELEALEDVSAVWHGADVNSKDI